VSLRFPNLVGSSLRLVIFKISIFVCFNVLKSLEMTSDKVFGGNYKNTIRAFLLFLSFSIQLVICEFKGVVNWYENNLGVAILI